ncbi:MAG TPA: NAD(P)H-dependent oxidoreductase subunit E [Solirubrobacteraceae bacterium]|jgi:NADH:ubiquinone oxidoreductase subunit E|nr:NAD(P)H-dependent oxidoreductase subunit E [Solirubrobacteraceae bacterium]
MSSAPGGWPYTGEPIEVHRFAHGSRVPGWDSSVDLEKDPATIPDPATTEVPERVRAEIEAHMAKYPDRHSAALPALAAAQRHHGWCSPEAIEQVACVMRLTPGYLTAVATFYDMFETEPVGRHALYVCTNISCSLCGADEIFAELSELAGEDPDVRVRAFECLGACDLAPMASVDGVYVGPLRSEDLPGLLDDVRSGRPVLPEKQLATRLVADPHANSEDFPRPGPVAGVGVPLLPGMEPVATHGPGAPEADPGAALAPRPPAGEPGIADVPPHTRPTDDLDPRLPPSDQPRRVGGPEPLPGTDPQTPRSGGSDAPRAFPQSEEGH